MSLRDRLMKARCSVALWGNERKDASVAAEVAQSKGVKKGKAGGWTTNLLAGADAEYNSLKSALNLARAYHYKTTLSWGKRGEHVLPCAMFLDYSREMLSHRAMADHRLEDLCAVWDERVKEAQLNSPQLTARFSYPAESELRKLCGLTIEINPLEESGDLLLNIEGEEAQKLLLEERTRMEALAVDRTKGAMTDLWTRFHKILINAKRNLDLADKEGRFRTEWHDNLTEFILMSDKMNFMEDEKLTELVKESEDILKTGSDVYKKEPDTRGEAEEVVNDILDKMKGVFE